MGRYVRKMRVGGCRRAGPVVCTSTAMGDLDGNDMLGPFTLVQRRKPRKDPRSHSIPLPASKIPTNLDGDQHDPHFVSSDRGSFKQLARGRRCLDLKSKLCLARTKERLGKMDRKRGCAGPTHGHRRVRSKEPCGRMERKGRYVGVRHGHPRVRLKEIPGRMERKGRYVGLRHGHRRVRLKEHPGRMVANGRYASLRLLHRLHKIQLMRKEVEELKHDSTQGRMSLWGEREELRGGKHKSAVNEQGKRWLKDSEKKQTTYNSQTACNMEKERLQHEINYSRRSPSPALSTSGGSNSSHTQQNGTHICGLFEKLSLEFGSDGLRTRVKNQQRDQMSHLNPQDKLPNNLLETLHRIENEIQDLEEKQMLFREMLDETLPILQYYNEHLDDEDWEDVEMHA